MKTPKGYRLGGLVDVATMARDVEKLWRDFEARFPQQSGQTPTLRGKVLIWYSKNGKTRRTKIVRLLEKLAIELGSLAGDVREVEREAPPLPPPPMARKSGAKSSTRSKGKGKAQREVSWSSRR